MTQTQTHQFLAGNVPLATSINSMPFHSLDAPLKQLALSNDRHFIAILDTHNNIKVFYVANWLKIIIDHTFNQQPKSTLKAEKVFVSSASYSDNEVFGNLFEEKDD